MTPKVQMNTWLLDNKLKSSMVVMTVFFTKQMMSPKKLLKLDENANLFMTVCGCHIHNERQ